MSRGGGGQLSEWDRWLGRGSSALETVIKRLHLDRAADDEGGALVDAVGDNLQDPAASIGGLAARLLDEEGNRVGFVQETEFAGGMVVRWWVEKDASLQKGTVNVGDHRANVAESVMRPERALPET